MIFDRIVKNIDKGRNGGNKGLPFGIRKLYDYIPGIQKGTYYLIGGELGTGKSAFVDHCFLYEPFEWLMKQKDTKYKMKVFYWSFEVDKHIKLTKLIARKLFLDYGILTDVNYVLSRGKHRVSDEVYGKVKELRQYFSSFEDILTIFDECDNPTGIDKIIKSYMQGHGITYKKRLSFKNGDTVEVFDRYECDNEDLFCIIIIDHIALLKKERSYETKQNIDKLSEYMISLRNRYGVIPVITQQLNRDMAGVGRFKLNRVEPQLGDFKDSGNTQQDANVVLALFSPSRYEMETFRGYNIRTLKDRFRSVSILKNRDGYADVRIGLQYVGETGYFKELPKAVEMNENMEQYNKIYSLENFENYKNHGRVENKGESGVS